MSRFLEHYTAWITPLSPIHIGTGEDYEPTNSVANGKELVHFDPLELKLAEEERERLIGILSGLDRYGAASTLLAIRRFFSAPLSRVSDAARIRIPLPPGVAEHIRATNGPLPKVSPSRGRKEEAKGVINQLAIPRAIRHPHTGALSLPGTSLKGAWRTAWLEKRLQDLGVKIPHKHKHQRFEWELLGGSFARDPFRLVKTGDASGDPAGAILLVLDVARARPRKNDPAVMTMVEAVLPGQFRSWQAAVAFLHPSSSARRVADKLPSQQLSMRKLAHSINTFSLRRWHAERRELQQNQFLARDWMIAVDHLLKKAISDRLQSGQALLMRLGHYSGEDFVSYGNEVRRETHNSPRPRKKIKGRETTPCIRLAGRSKTDREALPFGWVLVELAPAGEEPPSNAALAEFCDRWGEWVGRSGDSRPRTPGGKPPPPPPTGGDRPPSAPPDQPDISIPKTANGKLLAALRDQVIKFPDRPEKYQQLLESLTKQAPGWTPEEKMAFVALVDRLIRPQLGDRARHFKWKKLLDRIETLRPKD